MKRFSLLLTIFIILSCNGIRFEKDYYERISRIKLPDKYELIETYDNGETVTTTTFQIDSIVLQRFAKENHFETVQYPSYLFFMGNSYLKKQKPDFESKPDLLYVSGHSKTNTWLYIIDMKRKILWAEIQYPDWSGDSPGR